MNSELENSRVSIMGISNDLKFTDFLDPRVKSSLGEEEIVFPPYDANQLRDILRHRADVAFKPDVLTDDVIPLCAAFAAQEHGDARRALDLLRCAGEFAERDGVEVVSAEHVRRAQEKIELDRIVEAVRTLPTQSKLVLLAIIELEGDVEPDFFEQPDDLDCSFEQPAAIDSCTSITEPGEYELVADLQPEDGEACLEILTGNVTINGNGHTIDGSALSDSTDSTGILIDTSDDSLQEDGSGDEAVEIRDVRVSNWTDGVSLIQAEFLTMRGVGLQDNDHAIDAGSGNDFELKSVLIEGNGAVADEFWDFGQVEIRESEIRDNGGGLVMFDGTLEIHSSVIEDNGGAGIRFSDMGPGVTIADTTVCGNAGVGIGYRFASPDLQNVTLADNEGLELDQGPESAMTALASLVSIATSAFMTALPKSTRTTTPSPFESPPRAAAAGCCG
jgi:hypothetical protein